MLRSRQARFKVEALDERLELRPADAERGPERTRQRSAAREMLWQALEHIGEEHREILVLKELQGFRYAEIAQILDIPEGTVASRLYHARRALKDALVEAGICDKDGNISDHIRPALEVLATTDSFTRIYLEGNHDFSMGPYFTETLGARVYPDSFVLTLDSRRIYLAHGDTVKMKRGYALWRWLLRSPFFKAFIRLFPPSLAWRVAESLSRRSRGMGWTKPSVEEDLKDFARGKLAEGFDGVILAHSHIPGVHQGIDGTGDASKGFYANPGGWVNDGSFLVYDEGEFRIERSRG